MGRNGFKDCPVGVQAISVSAILKSGESHKNSNKTPRNIAGLLFDQGTMQGTDLV